MISVFAFNSYPEPFLSCSRGSTRLARFLKSEKKIRHDCQWSIGRAATRERARERERQLSCSNATRPNRDGPVFTKSCERDGRMPVIRHYPPGASKLGGLDLVATGNGKKKE